MTDLLRIELKSDRGGDLSIQILNESGLDQNALKEVLAFSAPLFLANQLAALNFGNGLNVVNTIEAVTKEFNGNGDDLEYIPFDHFYKNFWNSQTKNYPNIEQVNTKIKATLVMFRNWKESVRVKVKLQDSILRNVFHRYLEEKMTMLVVNHSIYVLKQDLGSFGRIVPDTLNLVCSAYNEFTHDPVRFRQANKFHKDIGKAMLELSLNLHDFWKSELDATI